MPSQTESILRLPHVGQVTSLGKTTIRRLVTRGEFPPPIRLSARAVGWRAGDVQQWLDSRSRKLPNTPQGAQ